MAIFLLVATACAPAASTGARGSEPRSAATAAATAPATPLPTPPPSKLTPAGLFPPSSPPQPAPTHARTPTATGAVPPPRLATAAPPNRHDFLWPFRPTADYVKNADATFINLESPLLAG